MKTENIPQFVSDSAPSPDEFGDDETVSVQYRGQIAFDYDGGRICADCVNPEYADLAIESPREIPYGGAVPYGSEVDCPGCGCEVCHREIEGFTLLHYEGVCGEHCPLEN